MKRHPAGLFNAAATVNHATDPSPRDRRGGFRHGTRWVRFPEIELAIPFGSGASGALLPCSDLDLAVGGARKLTSALRMWLTEVLAQRFGRPVPIPIDGPERLG